MKYGGLNQPFQIKENSVKPLSTYIEDAKHTLVKVIDQYRNIYGKSVVDQTLLIPEDYSSLIWFLFPSEVISTLLKLKNYSFLEI